MPDRETRNVFEHDPVESSERGRSGSADSRLGSVTPWCKALSRDESVRDLAYGGDWDDDLDSNDNEVDQPVWPPLPPTR